MSAENSCAHIHIIVIIIRRSILISIVTVIVIIVTSQGCTRQAAPETQGWSCTYLGHHELEHVVTITVSPRHYYYHYKFTSHYCCYLQDPFPDVRQSAFALLGDLSRVCAPHLQPIMKQLLALAIQNMESHCISLQNMSACNNACWSMGTLLLCTLCYCWSMCRSLLCTLSCEALSQCGTCCVASACRG